MLSTEPVEWTDDRVEALHRAMFAETGAIYKDWVDALTPDEARAATASLAVRADDIALTLLALDGDLPVATAAVRPALTGVPTEWEVKRVYVAPSHRGRGLSRALMVELEDRCRAFGATALVLETGGLQHAAIALYESLGFTRSGVFPPYGAFPGEICFRKPL
ncbi:GNAT family N-acetyltransferase [Naasia lichenicola]|uniref:GNAT family N-acetyltransferase n=1 Tax=Naasia lichenicola TaxID=2565933 RepID=A0A4S4FHR2_9MICO|nr:GNAT family N-acetyltransferase [Naasia lichenicola]THG29631.1 GNAT family N-acetyltransferase [Naasia lichenicola]